MGNGHRVRHVVIFSSSLGLLVRPRGGGQTYPRVLEQLLNASGSDTWLVHNHSRHAAHVLDLRATIFDIVAMQPDIVVLNVGHIEAVRHTMSRRVWHLTYRPIPGLHPYVERARALGRVYKEIRQRFKITEHWVPPRPFERTLQAAVKLLGEETGARIILLGPSYTSGLEPYLPGSMAAQTRYNAIMRAVADTYGAAFMTIADALATDPLRRPLEAFVPDTNHLNAEGHRLVAQSLLRLVVEADLSTSRSEPVAGLAEAKGQ